METKLVLGTMIFGSLVPAEDAFIILDHFFDQGFNTIDTAPIYPSPCTADSFGLTEQIIGQYVTSRGIASSHHLSVITKIPNNSSKLPYARNHSGPISISEFKSSIASSLFRLRLKKVDTIFLHWPSRSLNNFGRPIYTSFDSPDSSTIHELASTIRALVECAKELSIPTVGLSNESPTGVMHLTSIASELKYSGHLSIQNPYNLLTPYYDIALAELCQHKGVTLYAHSPLAFGTLASRTNTETSRPTRTELYPHYFSRYKTNTARLLESLFELAYDNNLSLQELALRYVLSNPTVSHIIIGPRTIPQLTDAIAAYRRGPLPSSILVKINEIHATTQGFAF